MPKAQLGQALVMDVSSQVTLSKRQFLGGAGVSCLLLPGGGILLSGMLSEPAIAAGIGATPKFSLKQGSIVLNKFRAQHGRKPLKTQKQLQRIAVKQATLMAKKGKMAHSFGGATRFPARVRAAGFKGKAAENIAAGQRSLDAVFAAWEKSSGHRRNMLNRDYRFFGLAVRSNRQARYGHYWALVLGV